MEEIAVKSWTWQKWVGKVTPVVVGVLTIGAWEFAELPAPGWAADRGGAAHDDRAGRRVAVPGEGVGA